MVRENQLASRIRHLSPCREAVDWLVNYTNPEEAWAECERGDWMLWLLGTQAEPLESDERKKLVLAACDCAELALPYTNDPRVEACIYAAREACIYGARRGGSDEATVEELREWISADTNSDAAYDAAEAAYAAYAIHTCTTANTDGEELHQPADTAAAVAVHAAYAAAFAASADADADADANAVPAAHAAARKKMLASCANIIRTHYPRPPKIA